MRRVFLFLSCMSLTACGASSNVEPPIVNTPAVYAPVSVVERQEDALRSVGADVSGIKVMITDQKSQMESLESKLNNIETQIADMKSKTDLVCLKRNQTIGPPVQLGVCGY